MRRYRLDKNGNEQPVWASQRKIAEMGAEAGRAAARDGYPLINYGNPTYDDAAREAYAEARCPRCQAGNRLKCMERGSHDPAR